MPFPHPPTPETPHEQVKLSEHALRNIANRPIDISAVIDALTTTNPLHDTIDPDHIGIAGHSLGATTALTLATHSRATGRQRDPRITAIAAIAPGTNLLTDEQLATITTPTLVIGGTLDTTTPIVDNSTRLAEITAATRIDINGAGHLSFTTTCNRPATPPSEPTQAEQELVDSIASACGPDLTEPLEVHNLTQRYIVAFFRTQLSEDLNYEEWLAPTEGATIYRP